MVWLAGVDGCRDGWIAAFLRPDGTDVRLRLVPHFADIFADPESPAIVAVDIPIGLPERAGVGGRAAENQIRPLLGTQKSSVFSVCSRAAMYAGNYDESRRIARATSDPSRSMTKQLFCIVPKIREVDDVLRRNPSLVDLVFEIHPEVAFWQLNGQHPLNEPKKKKRRPNAPGLALRKRLLVDSGIPPSSVEQKPPRGAGPDDWLDALACAAIARRIFSCIARPFPDPPPLDQHGLRMAIWA